ncbi:MAG: pilus assembly protein N-terminal domain-containing protein, partial [Hyphomicrobiales bacterium]|nr:pilus assembly protein N-terminal domain-containing protein [Hyphomicrobiales bacterium]
MSCQYEAKIDIAGTFRRRQERGGKLFALLQRCRAAAIMTLMIVFAIAPCELRAQERIALTRTAHTTIVNVLLGKSQDVHTDQAIVDISVGDPGIADVNPLTDHALSILGKKIGTTRVTVYGEDKKLVGIFDIEVSYDISRASTEIAALSGGGIRVSSVNGRILLTGTAPDAVTVDKAVMIARQFVPDPINTVQVLRPQQIMLEVRFIEVSRSASRELGMQWNIFGAGALANIGNQAGAQQLPITAPGGAFQQPGTTIGGMNTVPLGSPGGQISPVVAAGVLSGAAPFGFLVSQLGSSVQMSINALEQRGLARSLAEPNLVALSGDTASFLAGGQFPVPEANGLGTVAFAYQPYGVGLSFTPTVLKGGLINLIIKPEVSEI